MGGYGSGRQGWRGVIEHRLRLDIRTFRRWGWLAAGQGGVLRWSRDGEETASLAFGIDERSMVLAYQTKDHDGKPLPIQIRVPIARTPCRYGGCRRYWLCPRCGRRCELLVVAGGGRSWGCRGCLRLRYVCQGLAPAERMQARARKIFALLNGESDFPLKPKWMRWRVFHRLVEQAQDFDSMADIMFAGRCMARFGMLPGDWRNG